MAQSWGSSCLYSLFPPMWQLICAVGRTRAISSGAPRALVPGWVAYRTDGSSNVPSGIPTKITFGLQAQITEDRYSLGIETGRRSDVAPSHCLARRQGMWRPPAKSGALVDREGTCCPPGSACRRKIEAETNGSAGKSRGPLFAYSQLKRAWAGKARYNFRRPSRRRATFGEFGQLGFLERLLPLAPRPTRFSSAQLPSAPLSTPHAH